MMAINFYSGSLDIKTQAETSISESRGVSCPAESLQEDALSKKEWSIDVLLSASRELVCSIFEVYVKRFDLVRDEVSALIYEASSLIEKAVAKHVEAVGSKNLGAGVESNSQVCVQDPKSEKNAIEHLSKMYDIVVCDKQEFGNVGGTSDIENKLQYNPEILWCTDLNKNPDVSEY